MGALGFKFGAVALAFGTLLSACGGGSGAPSDAILEGQLKDSLVEGVAYRTPTQSGLTDQVGKFRYRDGETVVFSIGSVVLGAVPGKPLITPVDLVPGAQDIENETVINIARLLQSLDVDGNPDNGIRISAQVHSLLDGKTIDFSAPAFGAAENVVDLLRELNTANVFGTSRRLVSAAQARAHLRASLLGPEPAPAPVAGPVKLTIVDGAVYSLVASALDSRGRLHVIAVGDHAYHFFRGTDGWHSARIPDVAATASDARLVIDGRDDLHFFLRDGVGSRVNYATNRSGYWATETLEDAAVAVDTTGSLYVISQGAAADSLKYGRFVEGRWVWELFNIAVEQSPTQLSAAVPSFMRLVIDSTGIPHVVFSRFSRETDQAALYYSTIVSGSWRTELLDYKYLRRPSGTDIALDTANSPHIAYGYMEIIHGSKWCNPSPCDNADQIDYFTRVDATWQTTMVDGQDYPSHLSLYHGGPANIGVFSHHSGLLYRLKSGDSWTQVAVPNELIASKPAFGAAADPSGKVHLARLSEGFGLIRAAACNQSISTYRDKT